jgi:hypothetical protein
MALMVMAFVIMTLVTCGLFFSFRGRFLVFSFY